MVDTRRAASAPRIEGAVTDQELGAEELPGVGFWIEDVSRQILRRAMAATGAQFAVLQVLDQWGAVRASVQEGVLAAGDELMSRLPALGALLAQVRQSPASERRDSVSPLARVVSAPIMIDEQLVATMQLVNETSGGFRDVDQRSVQQLADMAAVALRLARRATTVERHSKLTEAGAHIRAGAFTTDTAPDLLRVFADEARGVISCDACLVLVGNGPEAGRVLALSARPGYEFLREHVTRLPFEDIDDLLVAGAVVSGTGLLSAAGPLQGILGTWAVGRVGAQPRPELTVFLVRQAGAPAFTDEERAEIGDLCERLDEAVRAERELREREASIVRQHRDRLAEDLHDFTIQRIFAAGLALQVHALHGDVPQAVALDVIAELNETINELRGHLEWLDEEEAISGSRVRQALAREISRVSATTGVVRAVELSIDRAMMYPQRLANALVACVREGLANALRHGEPSWVDVRVEQRQADVEVSVSDNGGGLQPGAAPGRGLANLERRARELGGWLRLDVDQPGVTLLRWWVPLAPSTSHGASR